MKLKVLTNRRYFVLSDISSISEWWAAVDVFTPFRKVPEEPSKSVGTVVNPASEGPWWGAALRTKGGLTAAMGVCEHGAQCAQEVPSRAESKG